MSTVEKSERYKERISRQRKKEYQDSREKARQRQYDIQAQSTKEQWDINQKRSDSWRKDRYNKSFFYKVRKFFEGFHKEQKPSEGLLSKKEENRNKKNIFQRIFKRKNKKKKK